jgi:plastocyanin
VGKRMTRRRLLRSIGIGILSIGATPLLTGCPTRESSAATITMRPQNNFSPSSLTVSKGTRVFWKNTDTTPHTTTCDPAKATTKGDVSLPSGAPPWDSGILFTGDTWARTFDVPGTYVYLSVPDEGQGMVGTIVVRG